MKTLFARKQIFILLIVLALAQFACNLGAQASSIATQASQLSSSTSMPQATQTVATTTSARGTPAEAQAMLKLAVAHYQAVGRESRPRMKYRSGNELLTHRERQAANRAQHSGKPAAGAGPAGHARRHPVDHSGRDPSCARRQRAGEDSTLRCPRKTAGKPSACRMAHGRNCLSARN